MTAAVLATLGIALAAIQLVPTAHSALLAKRSEAVFPDLWSLRPTALLEMVWFQFFGDYLSARSILEVPWLRLVYTDREPLLFSLYMGVPLLTLAAFGLAGDGPRRWRLFWVAAALVSLIASFGAYTPIYPIFRDHVPVVGSLRFPVKYIVLFAVAVAAGATAGWDALAVRTAAREDSRRLRRGRAVAVSFAVLVGTASLLAALMCQFAPSQVAPPLSAFAIAMGATAGQPAAEFILKTVPSAAVGVVALSLSAAALIGLAVARRPLTGTARLALIVIVVIDLCRAGVAINPVVDPAFVAQPQWTRMSAAHPDSRVYVGGKQGGTLDPGDRDSSRAFLGPAGLPASGARAALTIQAVFYPSAWRTREMLSYDLAVLWPSRFEWTAERFRRSDRERRDRFLDRTGVRFRILPQSQAPDRTPIMRIPYFLESFLFDWGGDVTPRVCVVGTARVVPEELEQLEALFRPDWDSRAMVLVRRQTAAAGVLGTPVPAFARILAESSNHVSIEAAAPRDGGYLVLLDSYSTDWSVTVDGRRADLVQANGLFRAVRLVSGRHVVEFAYRPKALVIGATISGFALLIIIGLAAWRRRLREYSTITPS